MDGKLAKDLNTAKLYSNNTRLIVDVIIPALNEAEALPYTLRPLMDFVNGIVELSRSKARLRKVILVDNGSTDGTIEVAKHWGAHVLSEPRRGYGQACLLGINELKVDPPQAVLFVDADGSDDLSELDDLLARDEREKGWGLGQIIEEADKKFPNEAGLEELQELVSDWLNLL